MIVCQKKCVSEKICRRVNNFTTCVYQICKLCEVEVEFGPLTETECYGKFPTECFLICQAVSPDSRGSGKRSVRERCIGRGFMLWCGLNSCVKFGHKDGNLFFMKVDIY